MTDIVATLNVALSVALFVMWLSLMGIAIHRQMPLAMVVGLIGGGLMAGSLILDSLPPAGIGFDHVHLATLTLRFAATIVLVAALWMLSDSPEHA